MLQDGHAAAGSSSSAAVSDVLLKTRPRGRSGVAKADGEPSAILSSAAAIDGCAEAVDQQRL
jgi:hypothetical protein